jgi:predicted HTH domain antitoxin
MSINIQLPEGLNLSPFDLSMMLASKLFEEGFITSGQGAEMTGLSKQAFLELLGKYGVSAFQTPPDDLEDDLKNA